VSLRGRTALFLASAAGLGAVLIVGFAHLPDFGHYSGPYGLVLNDLAVSQRHATDVVTAVNFDYRAFDTLGEEFMLFAAAVGVMLLLREVRGEQERPHGAEAEEHRCGGSSESLHALALVLAGPLLVLGVYIVSHGHISPGGGFQGGVILGAAVLLVYLAGETVMTRWLEPGTLMEVLHSVGAAGLALLGLGGLVAGGAYFHNFLSTGTVGLLNSGGIIPLGNAAVGLEVMGATLLLASELLEQTLIVRQGGG
jgi:multicomponent Na+:H+ antiporter subunit B